MSDKIPLNKINRMEKCQRRQGGLRRDKEMKNLSNKYLSRLESHTMLGFCMVPVLMECLIQYWRMRMDISVSLSK